MQLSREIPVQKTTLGGSFLWVNLDRYPLFEKHSSKRLTIEEDCARQIKETGIALLPGFLNDEGLKRMIEEARSLIPLSFHSHVEGNAYLSPCDDTLPADHTINLTEPTSLGAIAYDQIPKAHALRKLYECDHLMDFISSSMVRNQKLYRYADPMGALNISVMKDGDYLRWHFDQTDFVVSICLQDADSGGDFEYVPFIRSAATENYDQVKHVLQGDMSLVKKVPMEPGTLVFFEGRHAIHRVTPIKGSTPRLIALLGYDTKPGTKSSEHLHYLRYGRTI
jgi:hypothetical protein